MPKIFPFRAYRYALSSRDLSRAVCPPYDVIGKDQAETLRENPLNAIHIELPEDAVETKYGNARRIWDQWKKEGAVRRDEMPAFYLYEQIFTVRGKKFSRKGFFCELEVEKPGAGSVLRHELTLAGPKMDRLNLLKAMHLNTSPIFGLFDDPKGRVEKILRAAGDKPEVEFKDPEKVLHRMWRVTVTEKIQALTEALGKTPVLIADGHHRYETAWNFHQETNLPGSERTLFFVCPMDDPGLIIFPTHRILLKEASLGQALARVQSFGSIFKTVPLAFSASNTRAFSAGSGRLPFAVTDGKKAFAIHLKSLAALRKALPETPSPLLRLPLFQLHALLVPELQKEDFAYVYDGAEALAMARDRDRVAFLVPAASAQDLYQVVRAGALMPQKSTYFYPKIITGLVFRSFDP